MMHRRWLLISLLAIAVASTGCDGLRLRMRMNDAHRLFNAKKYEESIGAYQKVLEIDSNNWMAKYQIAVANMASFHPGSLHPKDKEFGHNSIAGFEELLDKPAPSKELQDKVREFYVAMLAAAEENDKAVKYYEGELSKNPKDTKIIASLAQLYWDKLRQFTPAMTYYNMLCTVEPDKKENWYTVGERYWERSYHGAKENQISIEERQRVISSGLDAMDHALKIDPEYWDALVYTNLLWRERAAVQHELSDDVMAQESIKKATEYQDRAKAVKAKQPKTPPAQ